MAITITVSQFRLDYPEFTDTTLYPDSQITYYLNLAGLLLNVCRWGNILNVGAELFVAHNIAIERQAQATAINGGVPGISSGPVSSKSVDKVSVSYDTQAGLETGAGHWNLTIYGTRFIRLAKMMGSGPIYVGVPTASETSLSSAGAWPGPNTAPGWFGS